MKLLEAMEKGEKDPETPLPIRAGRCEARSGVTLCGSDARWWYRHQFRCSEHKQTP